MSEIGFIILRHVNNELTNKYWILCYDRIREYYPENKILIIDDNSNYKYITKKDLYKTTIIDSEYKGRGELLPYYYYLSNKLFDIAVILHDSVFINRYIDIEIDKYKFIWCFEHKWNEEEKEIKLLKVFEDDSIIDFYNNKELWRGCFGCMSIIRHDYLEYVNSRYEISKLLDEVLTRSDRSAFERVLACLLIYNSKEEMRTLYGNIHKYTLWGRKYKHKDSTKHLPLTKIWTGR